MLLLGVSQAQIQAHADQAPADWKAAAQQDIRFLIDTIRERDAGSAAGRLDVTMPLDAGAVAALAQAERVQTQLDYRRLIVGFVDSFADPHLGIRLHLKAQGWTGIVLDRVDEQYRVIWSEPGWPGALPPQGATVQSCDGEWIGSYLKGSVAPFINHGIEYPTTFSELARQSMFDIGLGWTPKTCRFILRDGSRKDFDLPLRAIPDEVSEARVAEVKRHFAAAAKPVGIYRLGRDKLWLGMPNFDGRVSSDAYDAMYRHLANEKHAKWVVLDLRGNGGGDSSWGNRALQALYGKEYGEKLDDMAGYVKELTANESTIELYRRYASLPEFIASRSAIEKDLHAIEAAHGAGRTMAQVDGMTLEQALAEAAQLRTRPHGSPRIAALIDRGCFSSCMNLVQQISAIGDTVILGEPTLGYSAYGEINSFSLPSGHGSINVPSAVYTAFQAPREPFMPAIAYAGNMADDEAVMKWVDKALSSMK